MNNIRVSSNDCRPFHSEAEKVCRCAKAWEPTTIVVDRFIKVEPSWLQKVWDSFVESNRLDCRFRKPMI